MNSEVFLYNTALSVQLPCQASHSLERIIILEKKASYLISTLFTRFTTRERGKIIKSTLN